MVQGSIDAQPFAMEFHSKGKSLAVKELNVEDGRISVLLVPLPPSAATASSRVLTPPPAAPRTAPLPPQ